MKLFRIFCVAVVLCVLAVVLNDLLIPKRNTSGTHFDVIVVLGNPTTLRNNPSSEQRERVLEAVREYKAGVASTIIMTGGAAHNQFVEADGMAALADRQGVPASAILKEPQAMNTIQNIYYSSEIMHKHGWSSAEVISSSAHLGRAALILQAMSKAHPDLAITWQTHPALWPVEYGMLHRLAILSVEAGRCLEIRIFGFPKSRFLPNV